MEQSNEGDNQRVAGRDYIESIQINSIRAYIAITPPEKLDAESVDQEELFEYRFGVSASPAARKDFLQIKRLGGFTNREMTWLRRAGQLKLSRDGTKLRERSAFMLAVGIFYMTVAALFFPTSALQIHMHAHAAAWARALGIAVMVAAWIGSSTFIWNLFIGPWVWSKPRLPQSPLEEAEAGSPNDSIR